MIISNESMDFNDPKELDDPQGHDDLKFISNESMDFNDPKEFDDHQVFKDPKGTSIGSMNLIIQKSSFPMVLFVCLWFAIFVSDKG